MGNPSGLPSDNRIIPPRCNPWGSHSEGLDDTALLLNEMARRCKKCKKVILNRNLRKKDGKPYCPDCADPSDPLFFDEKPSETQPFSGCGDDGDAD